jgi:hypothetical protein
MAKTAAQRLDKQADKLGLTAASRAKLHADWGEGKVAGSKPGDGAKIREYIESNPDRFERDANLAAQRSAERDFKKAERGNPFDRTSKHFSLQRCGEIYKSSPKLAESLARAAGWSLDGRPIR